MFVSKLEELAQEYSYSDINAGECSFAYESGECTWEELMQAEYHRCEAALAYYTARLAELKEHNVQPWASVGDKA